MEIRTILVPTDFSPHADRALEIASDLAEAHGARIVLLHAFHSSVPSGVDGLGGGVRLPKELHDRVHNYTANEIEKRSQAARERGIEVTPHVVTEAASLAILDAIDALNVDWIVMGTRGRGGLKHVSLGSTAERIVREASCPVLTVKA